MAINENRGLYNKAGRPTKYKPEYAEQARRLCLVGFIDKELAEYFEVEESTINYWKKQYPEFLESIIAGKEIADAKVAEALYKRAIGYEAEEGDNIKKYPPEVTAAKFWLINRQRGRWSERIDHDHSGSVSIQYVATKVNKPKNAGTSEIE